MIYDNVLDAMGHTPLVRLNRIPDEGCAEILVKYEALNPGGSIKTRSAYNMILGAEQRGEITPGKTTIVEPTSGNQGIGLALVCAVRGYAARIIMPDSVSVERRKLCQAYGAEVQLVHDAGDIGAAIEECARLAREAADSDPDMFMPDQFSNPDNAEAQRMQTAQEILEDIDGKVDGFTCGFGTGGTLTGVGEVLRGVNPNLLIWAAEPELAALLSGGKIGTHMQMGIGDGILPDILNQSIIDETTIVSDDEAIEMARRLAAEEGLLCGISSGTNVVAALRMARVLGPGKRVVTILSDTGERYFSTPLYE